MFSTLGNFKHIFVCDVSFSEFVLHMIDKIQYGFADVILP